DPKARTSMPGLHAAIPCARHSRSSARLSTRTRDRPRFSLISNSVRPSAVSLLRRAGGAPGEIFPVPLTIDSILTPSCAGFWPGSPMINPKQSQNWHRLAGPIASYSNVRSEVVEGDFTPPNSNVSGVEQENDYIRLVTTVIDLDQFYEVFPSVVVLKWA